MLPISVHEFLTSTDSQKRHGIDITATGVVAVFSGSILSVYYDTGKQFEPWLGAMPFNSDITVISWCKNADASGEVPYHLFVGSENGECLVLNMHARTQITSFNLASQGEYVTSVSWFPSSNSKVYLGTSTGDVYLFSITYKITEPIWSHKAGFIPHFLLVSPYDDNQIIIASKTGEFSILSTSDKASEVNIMKFTSEGQNLVDVRYYPYYNGVIVFVMCLTVYVYIIDKNCFIPLLSTGSSQEPIRSMFFPDNENMNNIILIYQSHCLFIQNDNLDFDKARSQYVKFLTPLKQSTKFMLNFATYQNKLYIYGVDNTLQLFEFKNRKIWTTRISRQLCSNPNDFDANANASLVFGHNGLICITQPDNNSCSLCKFIRVKEYNINKIYWLSKTCFLFTVMTNGHPNVIFGDYSKMAFTPLLRKTLEMMSDEPAEVVVSPKKTFFTITLQKSMLMFFEFKDDYFRLIKSGLSTYGTIGVFSDDETEYWTINPEGKMQKLKINLSLEEQVYSSRFTNYGDKLGKPKTCAIVNDTFLVGMANGSVIVFDWFGTAPITLAVPQKTPVLSVLSFDKKSVIFIDKQNTVCLVDTNIRKFGQYGMKASKVLPINEKAVMILSPEKNAITTVLSENFSMFAPPISVNLNNFPINMKLKAKKKGLVKELTKEGSTYIDWVSTAYRLHFSFIGDLFQPFNDKRFSVSSLGSNLSSERVNHLLKMLYSVLEMTDNDNVRISKMRIAMMLGHSQDVFNLLISESADVPTFALNVMKASYLNTNKPSSKLSLSIEKLIEGEKFDDALDLLFITKQFKEAVDLMIKIGSLQFAALVAKMKLEEKDDFLRAIEVIANALNKKKRVKSAASLLIGIHKFKEAATVLNEGGYLYPAAVINALKVGEDGILFFDSMKLVVE